MTRVVSEPAPLSSSPLICLVTDRRVLTDSATGGEAVALPQLLEVIADCASTSWMAAKASFASLRSTSMNVS